MNAAQPSVDTSFNYFTIIPEWQVSVEVPQLTGEGPPQQILYRVSDTDLDAFIHVLTLNRASFHVTAPE